MVYDFNGDGKGGNGCQNGSGDEDDHLFADGRVKRKNILPCCRRIWRPAVPMGIIMSAVQRITESIWRRFSRSGRGAP